MLPSTQQRTNGQTDVKATYIQYMSITYLDVTCAQSGLEPPFSQMSCMEIISYTHIISVVLHLFVRSYVAVSKILHFVLCRPD